MFYKSTRRKGIDFILFKKSKLSLLNFQFIKAEIFKFCSFATKF